MMRRCGPAAATATTTVCPVPRAQGRPLHPVVRARPCTPATLQLRGCGPTCSAQHLLDLLRVHVELRVCQVGVQETFLDAMLSLLPFCGCARRLGSDSNVLKRHVQRRGGHLRTCSTDSGSAHLCWARAASRSRRPRGWGLSNPNAIVGYEAGMPVHASQAGVRHVFHTKTISLLQVDSPASVSVDACMCRHQRPTRARVEKWWEQWLCHA
eukprot:278335-Chlamydomonas_euryale.AAC.13